jgi:hypothetical protein
MYLFIFADGRARQVHDNLTVTDLLAVKEKVLRIFTVVENNFVLLTIDNEKITPVPVVEGRIIQGTAGRIHHI